MINFIFGCFLVVMTSTANASTGNSSYKKVVDEFMNKSMEEQAKYLALIKDNEKQAKQYEKRAEITVEQAEIAFKKQVEYLKADEESLVGQIIKNSKNLSTADKINKTKGLIIFVSFSMPKELLFKYHMQAMLYGGRLVIRGLVDNDFKKTIQFMDLGNQQKLTVDVDPMLFKEHKIVRVPTIVISDGNSTDKFTGTISVKYALEEISANGDAKDFANTILHNLKNKNN